MKKSLFLLVLVVITTFVSAQHHSKYIPETDSLVLEKLEQWQDLKFGLLMHWGPYSQWGIVESWSLCPEEIWLVRTEKKDLIRMIIIPMLENMKNLKIDL